MSILLRPCLPVWGALLALTFIAVPASANDSFAELAAGGLVVRKTDAVRMTSEVLRISLEKIEVDYLFDNVTGADVTTTVTFPMPDLDKARLEGAAGTLPAPGKTNFMNFRVWADGKEIIPKAEIRAFMPNRREITEDLRKLGVDPVAFTYDKTDNPPETPATKVLNVLGFLDNVPQWTTTMNYYWTQTFPAGKRVAIRHTYAPVAGFAAFPQVTDEWCMDAAFNAAVNKIISKRLPNSTEGIWVKYILKTGANWAGPIGTFTLIIDKGESPLVSTCAIPGLKLEKKGQTFTATAKDYTPTTDLNILFVAP